MAQALQAGGFDLRLLVVSADEVGEGPVKTHCPNPDHDDRVSSCAVYHDGLRCFACGLVLNFDQAANALDPSLAPLRGRQRLEALGQRVLATKVPQAKRADVGTLALTAWQAHEGLDEAALAWWSARGFTRDLVARYGFGATTRAYTIPLVDHTGKFWGLKYRRRDDTIPMKYWSASGQRAGVHVPPLARASRTAVLTEGELDAALLDSIGLPAISLTSGAKMDPRRHLEPWDRIIVAYDQDQAGQDGAGAIMDALAGRAAYWIKWPADWGKDPGELRTNGKLGRVARMIVERWV